MHANNANRTREWEMMSAETVSGLNGLSNVSEPLLGWSGLAAVLAALVAAPAWIASVVQEDPWSSWPILIALTGLLLAIPALFAAQSAGMGRLGRIGVVLMMIGGVFEIAAMTTVMIIQAKVGLHGHERFILSGSVAPHFAALSGLAVAFYVGAIMFGLATVRAGVFPRRTGQLAVIGSIGMIVGAVPDITGLVAAGAIVQAGGFASMGWQVWRRQW